MTESTALDTHVFRIQYTMKGQRRDLTENSLLQIE